MVNDFAKNKISESVKTPYIFSVNCSAQDKNYGLIQCLYTLVKGYNRFDKIIHRQIGTWPQLLGLWSYLWSYREGKAEKRASVFAKRLRRYG